MEQRTESHVLGAVASFGLTRNLGLSASLPLIYNRSVSRMVNETGVNVGNLSVSARTYFDSRLASMPVSIQLSGGATVPVGRGITNVETDRRNFASGTVDPLASLVLSLGIEPGIVINGRFYTRQVIATSSDGQRVGDFYAYNIGATYAPIGRSYELNTQLRVINRGQDMLDDKPFPNSGGDWILAASGFAVRLPGFGEEGVRCWGELELPLYQYVRGTQLTARWNVRFGFNFGFTLFGHQEDAAQEHTL